MRRGALSGRAGAPGLLCALRSAVAAVVLAVSSMAMAATIVIDASADPESRLDIRTVVLPGGQEVQVYVLMGRGMTVRIDDDVLSADHVEFDLTRRLVRVVGRGSFTQDGETVEGLDLLIDLSQESFEGTDVLIVTDQIDVAGESASRVPGLVSVALGAFSPCSRCDQEIEDYSFRARRIELYPGDRLVAHEVTVLVRGVEVAFVPLLVLPLGPDDRQPRLHYETGTSSSLARIELTWPYVAGPDARGALTLRYWADVRPGGGGVWDAVLGGAPERTYFGARLDHSFYTGTGAGTLLVDHVPGLHEADGRREPRWTVRFAYRDDPLLGPDLDEVLLQRDDDARPRLWEAYLRAARTRSGISAVVTSQVFVDVDPSDATTRPSYAGPRTPLLTPARIEVFPEEQRFSVGPLDFDRLWLDVGAFEDVSNPINRSAAIAPMAAAGRVVESHALTLSPLSPWPGARLTGRTAFTGYYYGTGERQVDWSTRAVLEQSFGTLGDVSATFTRDVVEGETPFRFDVLAYRARTDIVLALQIDPTPWLRVAQRGGYVFVDDRDPAQVGFLPLETTLTLLRGLDWLSLTVRNSYDIADGDPGEIAIDLALTARGKVTATLDVESRLDLLPTEDRLTGVVTDDSVTRASLSVSARGAFEASASAGLRHHPTPPAPGQAADRFEDLELSVTIGTLGHEDVVPGLALDYALDLDDGSVQAFGVELGATLGPVQVNLLQRLSFPSRRLAQSRMRAALPGVAALEARGITWLPHAAIGLEPPEPYARDLEVALEHAPLGGPPEWRLAYATRLDPALSGGDGGRRGSTLTARALLASRAVGPAVLSVDGFLELALADTLQPTTYLRRGNLEFGVDLYERVGLQGTLGYAAAYSRADAEVTSARLTLSDVSLVVRALDELYLGVVVDDVWDLTGDDPARRPEFRPEFTVVWDRCCWALLGSWDSATGVVRLTLTTPGADQGLSQAFGTGLALPGRRQ